MIHFGSCAKGTAISTTSDLDVAVYLTQEKGDLTNEQILEYIRGLLVDSMGRFGMSSDQFTLGDNCVKVTYENSKLEIDVVPIIPIKGASDDWGWLTPKNRKDRLKTSVPLHLEFIKRRREAFDKYAPFIRLTKWWKATRDVPLKPFAIELIWAHLIDAEEIPGSFAEGLPQFFKYIVKTQLEERISFNDNYSSSALPPKKNDIVEIYDPVNPENNVAAQIDKEDYADIMGKAQEALDVIMMATCAPSKTKAIEQWQRVFGTSFNPYNF